MCTAHETPLKFVAFLVLVGVFVCLFGIFLSKATTISFSGFQVLVLGNKRDLPNALDEKQLIEKM